MNTAKSAPSTRRPRRPARLRLAALAAAPLALAGTALAPAAASGPATPARPARSAAASTASANPQALQMPGLNAAAYTVTLITGARVTLRAAGGGRYTVTGSPAPGSASGPGSALIVRAQGGPAGVTSLQAVPQSAQPLISSGAADSGLFDVLYLLAHGDTGPAARIPVVIQYPGHPGPAALGQAGRLPGASVLAVHPGSGEVEVGVTARRAAAFWAALTGGSAAPGASGAKPGLAGGARRIWLAGHQTASSADGAAAAGQPVYPVTETIIRTVGAVDDDGCLAYYGKRILTGLMCGSSGFLWELAGPHPGATYESSASSCASVRAAKPFPVCVAWRMTYQVPAGVYYAENCCGELLTTDDSDHALEEATADLDLPQITVAGPTTISVNANRIRPVTVDTPHPASDFGAPDTMEMTRSLPDGQYESSFVETGPGDWWALPTPAGDQATIGNYIFSAGISLGRPPVTASVTAPGHLALDPVYPAYTTALGNTMTTPSRFSGRHTYPLVNAGEGTPADFSKINAHGKLALIRALPNTLETVAAWQLADAQRAGAAGVLIDAGQDGYGHLSPLPIWHAARIPSIPYAEIDAGQAAALTGLLARGTVRVTVADSGPSPYNYYLQFNQVGRISGSLSYAVSRRNLAEVTDSYHATAAAAMAESPAEFPPGVFIAGGSLVAFNGPVTLHEYYGPVSPDMVWWLQGDIPISTGGPILPVVFGQPLTTALNWNEPPAVPGALAPLTAVNQAQPGKFLFYCAGCRQGNVFYPLFWLINGASPQTGTQYAGFAPSNIHLYDQAGHQIPPTPLEGLTTYKLPPQSSGYRLVAHYGGVSIGWHFSTAEPDTDQTPPGTVCLGAVLQVSTQPCAAPPLVFLRYDAFTSLTNSVTAPGTHQLAVTAYHQAPGAPPVTSLMLWISTDGGKTWKALTTTGHDGSYQASYSVPPLAGTNGYVSIRAQAADAAGNDVTQTILNAYRLSQPAS